MKFDYLDVEQRSPEWLSARRGKVTASRLGDWLAVLKNGNPAKARLDYERELVFERQFGVNYNNFITQAMQEGIELEGFVRHELSRILGRRVKEVGCWHSEKFVASPDGALFPRRSNDADIDNATELVEIKVLKDNSFTDVLQNGIPEAHLLQVQGGLLASGVAMGYYAAFNTTTKAIKVIEVLPDKEVHDRILSSLEAELSVDKFDETGLHFVADTIPVTTIPEEDNPWTR